MLEEVGQGTGLFGKEVGNFRSASLGLNGTSGTINSAFTAFSGLTYARNRRIPERQRDELNHEAHGQIANPTKADGFGGRECGSDTCTEVQKLLSDGTC